jgi:prepilin-type N-terminal cleavage/methylation domain-containing protein
MKNTLKHVDNRGFSLIELLIAIAILIVLTTAATIGIGISRRRDTERYAKALQNQIQLMQTVSMTKTGTRRLALYCKNKKYYCVQEIKTDGNAADGTPAVTWESIGSHTALGYDGAVTWMKKNSSVDETTESEPVMVWQFSSDTGACISEAGSVVTKEISVTAKNGYGYTIRLYGVNGYCEVTKQ